MNITRHNYEEFFILYWDNELAPEQKKLVEAFVRENNDLEAEFRLFGETRFTPDENILFKEKDILLNKESAFINFSNYTEQLLTYLDDELTSDQKTLVENFVAKHPAVQQEFSILQKTKLQPETEIVFPDKSSLYRREEKVRMIRLTWMRTAVAAAILLLAGLATFSLINNNKKDGKPGIATLTAPVEKKAVQNKTDGMVANLVQTPVEQKQLERKIIKKSVSEKQAVQNPVAVINTENKNNLPKEKQTIAEPLIAKNNTTTQPDAPVNPVPRIKSNDAVAMADPEKKNPLFDNTTVTERPAPVYTVYTPLAGPKENADKGGLKGFLRKATRVFEHRTKMQTTTDDDKLLVGVFSVSLK